VGCHSALLHVYWSYLGQKKEHKKLDVLQLERMFFGIILRLNVKNVVKSRVGMFASMMREVFSVAMQVFLPASFIRRTR
jgi:hypothetical protein